MCRALNARPCRSAVFASPEFADVRLEDEHEQRLAEHPGAGRDCYHLSEEFLYMPAYLNYTPYDGVCE